MSQHSQGPWRIGEAGWSDRGNAQYELIGITSLKIADARLIAAAPDLLEALHTLANAYEGLVYRMWDRITDLGGDCEPSSVIIGQDPALNNARSILAKATGE